MAYRHLLNFWPLVPALDLEEIAKLSNDFTQDSSRVNYSGEPVPIYKLKQDIAVSDEKGGTDKEFNCLLVGSSLGCLMKTLARANRHESNNLNVYVADMFPESLTRCLVLLSLLNDSSPKFSLQEKSEMFLEILGNTHVRSCTADYVEDCSFDLLVKIGCASLSPIVSLDLMKQREIDELVRVLTYLKDKDMSFDVGKAWEQALRFYYGKRYDSRKNLFDYQFNMRLNDYSIINLKKYVDWCETGVAFKFRKAKYSAPNKTMRVQLRESRQNRNSADSFVGDIATSPYLVFGVETENPELVKKANNEFIFTGEDISKFNVVSMLEEYAVHRKKSNKKSVKVYLNFFDTLCKCRKFTKCFDVIYISCDMMHHANKLLPKFLKESGVVVFETIKNVVNSTKDQKEKHSDEIDFLAKSNGLKVMKYEKYIDLDNFKIFTM